MTNVLQQALEALWVCAEHNALHFSEKHNTVVQARAAIKALAQQGEPVAIRYKLRGDLKWQYTEDRNQPTPPCTIQELYTAAPAAQPLTEMKLLMITTAYEQGVGKGIQRRNANPYAEGTDEHRAWSIGYEEGLDKPAAQQGADK